MLVGAGIPSPGQREHHGGPGSVRGHHLHRVQRLQGRRAAAAVRALRLGRAHLLRRAGDRRAGGGLVLQGLRHGQGGAVEVAG